MRDKVPFPKSGHIFLMHLHIKWITASLILHNGYLITYTLYVTEHAKRAQLVFKNYIEFQCQTPTSVNFRQSVFSGDSVSSTIHLPSREVLEPITGSFILSAQLRDSSLFLDFTWPCKYGKLKFYLTHTRTLQSKQQPFLPTPFRDTDGHGDLTTNVKNAFLSFRSL